MQEAADQGRLAVIDMSDDDDADLGRVVPLGSEGAAVGTIMFMALLALARF